jgi:peptidoglycan/xylan/chitin deacetylase (PgdA/CDA1 family)
MYHDVCKGSISHNRYTLPQPMFRDHLRSLREQGIAVKDFSALACPSDARCAVLTFDDGLSSHYELVFPALLESECRAIFFATAALINTPGYLTWGQIREMSKAGMTFGSHGLNHIDYSRLDVQTAHRQLRSSRLALEDAISKPVSCFSAPYGFLNRTLIDGANHAGFTTVCSSRPWLASPPAAVIPRLAIYGDTDTQRFSALANGSALPLLSRFVRNAIVHLPKQLLLRTSPGRLGVRVQGDLQ